MKARAVILALALCLVGVGVAVSYAAEDVFIGTWKLKEANSKLTPGTAKNTTVVYEAMGDGVKVTVDGVDAEGKPTYQLPDLSCWALAAASSSLIRASRAPKSRRTTSSRYL